jgi:hypothetical protein
MCRTSGAADATELARWQDQASSASLDRGTSPRRTPSVCRLRQPFPNTKSNPFHYNPESRSHCRASSTCSWIDTPCRNPATVAVAEAACFWYISRALSTLRKRRSLQLIASTRMQHDPAVDLVPFEPTSAWCVPHGTIME